MILSSCSPGGYPRAPNGRKEVEYVLGHDPWAMLIEDKQLTFVLALIYLKAICVPP